MGLRKTERGKFLDDRLDYCICVPLPPSSRTSNLLDVTHPLSNLHAPAGSIFCSLSSSMMIKTTTEKRRYCTSISLNSLFESTGLLYFNWSGFFLSHALLLLCFQNPILQTLVERWRCAARMKTKRGKVSTLLGFGLVGEERSAAHAQWTQQLQKI